MLFKDDLQLLSDAPEAQLSLGRRCLSYFKGFNSLRAFMIPMTAWVSNDHRCKPELFSVLSVGILGRLSVSVDLQSLLRIWQLSRQSWNFMLLFIRPKSSLLCCKFLLRGPIWSQLNLIYTQIFHFSAIRYNNILPHKAGSLPLKPEYCRCDSRWGHGDFSLT